jgi:hypothetical protein
LPGGPSPAIWAATLALVVTLLGAWELFWRAAGVRPSARDPFAYVVVRASVAPSATVLLGTSKMQSDVDPDVWARTTHEPPPVDLAVAGSSPLPLLETLAADADFHGTVVMEILPRIIFASTSTRERAVAALEDNYREARGSPSKWIEARLSLAVSSALVLQRSGLEVGVALGSLRRRRSPPVPDFRMKPSRFLPLVFTPADTATRIRVTLARMRAADGPADPPLRDSIIARLNRAASAIQARGGFVAFVVMPGSGSVVDFENSRYPRSQFADALAASTPASMIQSEDYPELSGFACPDGSHIAESDTPRFTQSLASVIQRRLAERRTSPAPVPAGTPRPPRSD